MLPKLVYIATHGWNSPIRVGSHHLARILAQSSKTLYISHPLSIASLLSRADNQRTARLDTWQRKLSSEHTPPNVIETTCFMPMAPGPRWPQNSSFWINHGWRITFPNIKRLLEESEFHQPEQVWLDSIFQSFWIDLIHPRELIVRVADHPLHIARFSTPLVKKFRHALQRATLVVTPSTKTAEYLNGLTRSPIEVVPNGVQVDHFTQPREEPPEFRRDTRPKAVFVGALASWIDTNLLVECASLCPHISFYLIGPSHIGNVREHPPNLIILGSRDYACIPAYLQYSDVALAPFDVANQPEFVNSIDAIKLYEYVAAGLPVVATRWQQSLELAPYVSAVEQTPHAFANAIEQQIGKAKPTIPGSFVEQFDWQFRLTQIAKSIPSTAG